jgi:HEAT repeat protein
VAIPFLAWALKDEYWGVAPRAVAVLSEIGHAAVVPDLVRLAERRLEHGPFFFEKFVAAGGEQDLEPFLAAVAIAIGRCARGRWEGRTYLNDARATLMKLVASDDVRVRAAASEALSVLEETTSTRAAAESARDSVCG